MLASGLLLLAAGGSLAAVWRPGLWHALDSPVHDAFGALVPPPKADTAPVTVILVDDESLVRLGARWPLPRSVWADFLEKLAPLSPRAVALDAWFETAAPSDGVDVALSVVDELRALGLDQTPEGGFLAASLEDRASRLDGDRRFAQALAQLGRVVLGTACEKRVADVLQDEGAAGLIPLALPASAPVPERRCAHVAGSIPTLAQAARGQGSLHVAPDADGLLRRYPFWFALGEAAYPSLALATARIADPEATGALLSGPWGQGRGTALLRPVIPDDWRRLRFSDVMEAPADAPALAEAITDRVLFVGVSAQGTQDLVLLPVAGPTPGVFVHAAAFLDLLDGQMMDDGGPRARLGAGLGAVLLLLLGLFFGREPRPLRCLVAGSAAALGWLGLCALAFKAALLLPIAVPLGGVLGWTGLRLAFAWGRVEQDRRRAAGIRRAFQRYVSPEVVEELVRHPERLRLGGERVEITAFFSDLQGFTALSEHMDPDDLVALLNVTLGALSEVIIAEGGIIDKYIGDAVVAIFGAPTHRPDHAAAASRAALGCQRVMAELNRSAADRPALRLRIGLNTGVAVVGNMGSAQRFDYTMLGDAVNLAARLEGANGIYGSPILVGPDTAKQAADTLLFREVDAVRVKGRSQPVTLFQPLADRAQATAAQQRIAELSALALAQWRAGDWAGCAATFAPLAEAGDPVARTFLARIAEQPAGPPPGWDPVYTMTTK